MRNLLIILVQKRRILFYFFNNQRMKIRFSVEKVNAGAGAGRVLHLQLQLALSSSKQHYDVLVVYQVPGYPDYDVLGQSRYLVLEGPNLEVNICEQAMFKP